MPEDNNGAGQAPVVEAPQAAPEPFSAHQAVEDLFGSLNRSPRPESEIPAIQPHKSNDDAGQQGTPPAAPSAPSSSEDKTDWKKRYSDLQSDYDRRTNKVEEKLRAEFAGQMQQLAQAVILSRQQQPSTQQTDEGYDQPLTRKEIAAILQQERAQLRQEIAADPRLAVAGHIADYARFQDEKQDYRKYEPFFKIYVDKFPLQPGENLHGKLTSFYEFMSALEAQAAEQANKAGGAVNTNTPPPQNVHPNQAEQAAALMERAARYRMEAGVSPTAATRPAIDTYGNEEEAINAIVNSVMRGKR